MKNKSIGIIGGVGPQATEYLYGKIIELSQKKYGAKNNDDYPHLIIESLPIPDFISDETKVPEAIEMLKACVKRFSDSKVDRICIASNTVHILLTELQKLTRIEFLSMIDLVSNKCESLGYKKVGLLGTPVLTKSKLYNASLNERGTDLITPNEEELKIVEKIIRGVLSGDNHNVDKVEYIKLMNDIYSQGAEGIILGCTELPLAVDYSVLGKKVINSDEVLAEGIVDFYYNFEE
ncbi:amino acid racemase [Candidatus Woesebacteria bacterium]|nr:amino acid racemase [Candidatus Woesebacteria bacterium]